MPLKKKSGELPQVNILDTVEEFVVDFAESKYDEIYRWNVHGTTADKAHKSSRKTHAKRNKSNTYI